MSAAEQRDAPTAQASASTRDRSRQGLLSLAVVAVWLVGSVLLLGPVVERGGLAVSGEPHGLLPAQHRTTGGEPWLLLRADEREDGVDADQEGGEATSGNLLAAALAIAQAMPEERVPLAPPANAVTAWLDAHGLYLLDPESHAELADRLQPERVSAAIQGLTARLSSPLFGVSGEEARRDPLGLLPILTRGAGRFGHVHGDGAASPTVTGAGDLLAADGRALVIQLRSVRPVDALVADARLAVADLPISVVALGPDAHREALRVQTQSQWPRLASTLAAALLLVLALALRSIRPVLCLGLCLASGILLLELLDEPLTPLSLPFAVLLPAFACGGALRLQRISRRGWTGGALIATALAPLWISPYPEWEAWSLRWLIAATGMILTVRIVMPALLRLVNGAVQWRRAGFLLAPMPALGLLLLAGSAAAGVWAGATVRYAGAEALRLRDPDHVATQKLLRDHFFDPAQLVEARTPGPTPARALDRAAIEAQALAALVGPDAVRLDSPGSFVIPTPELQARMQSLSGFALPERMQELHDTLEAQGLRAQAFTEFLRGAANIESVPTAQAALDDALGSWISRYLVEQPDAPAHSRWLVRASLQLRPETTIPIATTADGVELVLLGPTIAVRHDAGLFRDRLGVYVAAGLWLGAFLVWLGTGSLAVAIASALTGLATQSAVLVLLALSGQAMGPQLLPALLLVGVAGIVAAGRACRAVDLRRPLVAGGMLTAGICQIAAGVALLTSPETSWQQMGLVVASGSAVAVGFGLFAAPGMCLLLRRAAGARPPADSPTTEEDDS